MTKKQVLIKTKSGPVKGLIKKSLLGDEYFSFQRIPYAKPPIGELRFKAPVAIDPWETTVDATNEGPVPYYEKAHFEGDTQSEDCLHLNVYSKNIEPCSKLPVIIFIYGGMFKSGSSTTKQYGPDYLMQKNVILVTFNYRIGPLGFLRFNDPALDIPGNAGLKDQLLVLKWVQNNIEFFGGDKDNVTLIGHSAGGVSAGLHLVSDKSKHLFHRAVIMSCSAFCTMSTMPQDDGMNFNLARATGWAGNDGEKGAYEHLLTIDAEILMKQSLITKEHLFQTVTFPFGPVIEAYDSESCFLNENPVKLARNAWSKDIDIINGNTSNEALYQVSNQHAILWKMMPVYQLVVPRDARNGRSEEELTAYNKMLRDLYNNFANVSATEKNKQEFFEFVNDLSNLHPSHRFVLSRLNHKGDASGKTFLYRFCYEFPTRNHHKIVFGATGLKGVCHGDELSYIFTNNWGPVPEKDTEEWNAVQKVVDLLTNFAENGSDALKTYGWDEIRKDDLPYDYKAMQIDKEWKMIGLPEIHNQKIWDSMYKEGELY